MKDFARVGAERPFGARAQNAKRSRWRGGCYFVSQNSRPLLLPAYMKPTAPASTAESLLVTALATEILGARRDVALDELNTPQRRALADVLAAHIAKLRSRYVQTMGLRHISESMLTVRLAAIDAEVQTSLRVTAEIERRDG